MRDRVELDGGESAEKGLTNAQNLAHLLDLTPGGRHNVRGPGRGVALRNNAPEDIRALCHMAGERPAGANHLIVGMGRDDQDAHGSDE